MEYRIIKKTNMLGVYYYIQYKWLFFWIYMKSYNAYGDLCRVSFGSKKAAEDRILQMITVSNSTNKIIKL